MRISTQQMYFNNLYGIQNYQQNINKLQEELSNNKKNDLSPYEKVQVMTENIEISKNSQYMSNIDFLQSKKETDDTNLDSINNILMKIKDLVTQFKNGSYNSNDLVSGKESYQELKNGVVNLLNQKNSNGNYIYSGTTNVLPFSDIYTYNGNQEINEVIIDDKETMELNIPGQKIIDNKLLQNFKDLDNFFNGTFKTISIDNLQDSINNISLLRTKIGEQLNRLTEKQNDIDVSNINSKKLIENIQGIDYAEEIMNLNKNQIALQAMYKISSSINQTNLFNFL